MTRRRKDVIIMHAALVGLLVFLALVGAPVHADVTLTGPLTITGPFESEADAAAGLCRAHHTTTQAVAASTEVAITFNTNDDCTGGEHSTSTNPTRFTIATAGVYTVGGVLSLDASNGSLALVLLRVNGTTRIAQETNAATTVVGSSFTVNTVYRFAANDYVELVAYHNGSVSVNTNNASTQNVPSMWIVRNGS